MSRLRQFGEPLRDLIDAVGIVPCAQRCHADDDGGHFLFYELYPVLFAQRLGCFAAGQQVFSLAAIVEHGSAEGECEAEIDRMGMLAAARVFVFGVALHDRLVRKPEHPKNLGSIDALRGERVRVGLLDDVPVGGGPVLALDARCFAGRCGEIAHPEERRHLGPTGDDLQVSLDVFPFRRRGHGGHLFRPAHRDAMPPRAHEVDPQSMQHG